MDPLSGMFGARRNEDIALDLMKFIAATTGFGKSTGPAGFPVAAFRTRSSRMPEWSYAWGHSCQKPGATSGPSQLTRGRSPHRTCRALTTSSAGRFQMRTSPSSWAVARYLLLLDQAQRSTPPMCGSGGLVG